LKTSNPFQEGFRVNTSIRKQLARRKQRIEKRLRWEGCSRFGFEDVVLAHANVKYELSTKPRGIVYGGIGLLKRVAEESGLPSAINSRLRLLKRHLPYSESDHVLNIAFNALCEGSCLQDIELRRNDENFLDALSAETIPDPTTAGDFCRRFNAFSVQVLLEAINAARLRVWRRQPKGFFDEALIDMDGTLVITSGECKQGMDISYKKTWGYHPLVVTLANTGEVLSIVNRSGNRPSHEGAAAEADRAVAVCRRGGFRRVRLRGDSAFSQTEHLDRWHDDGVLFQFGYDAKKNLVEIADNLPKSAWKKLVRPAAYQAHGPRRARPPRVKRQVVRRREFERLELNSEHVAEFEYQPRACRQAYRMVVVRKNISHEKGELRLFDEVRYFFYITNDRQASAAEIVFGCNDRCDQENLIAQLAGGVKALSAPVDNLVSNGAYMVMASLAWTLKAWAALWLPVETRCKEKHEAQQRLLLRMEFKTFVNAMVKLPCQIIRQARRTIFRVLAWNPHLPIFFRLCAVLRC
jgi:hypothetical protein